MIAVLLALNLIVKGTPLAMASGQQVGPMQPVPVALAIGQHWGGTAVQLVYRLWSDGQVDVSLLSSTCEPCLSCDTPTVVIPGTCPGEQMKRSINLQELGVVVVIFGFLWGGRRCR